MYKDRDKQREAVRIATQRYRAKGITKVSHNEGITKVSHNEGITSKGITLDKAIEIKRAARPAHHPSCKCLVCAIG